MELEATPKRQSRVWQGKACDYSAAGPKVGYVPLRYGPKARAYERYGTPGQHSRLAFGRVEAMTQAQAEQFFGDYRGAFNRFDASGVTECYAFPCVFSQNESPAVFESAEDLLLNNQRLIDFYREDGFEHASFGALQVHSFGSRHALVNVPWTIARRAPKDARRFHTAYNLRQHEGQWKIWAVAVFEEVGAFDSATSLPTTNCGDR